MGKLKNYIIKKLGGYTLKEYEGVANIQRPKLGDISRMELVYVKAKAQVDRLDIERIGASTCERLLKVDLVQKLMCEIEPIVQFTIWEPKPGETGYTAVAELQVARPAKRD